MKPIVAVIGLALGSVLLVVLAVGAWLLDALLIHQYKRRDPAVTLWPSWL